MTEQKKDEFDLLVEAYVDFADELVEMISEKRICVCGDKENYGKTCKNLEQYKSGVCDEK